MLVPLLMLAQAEREARSAFLGYNPQRRPVFQFVHSVVLGVSRAISCKPPGTLVSYRF